MYVCIYYIITCILLYILIAIGNMEALTVDFLFYSAYNHQCRTSAVEYTASLSYHPELLL